MLNVQQKNNFSERVRETVSKIPRGSVMTYKEVATRAGNPNGARAVGMIMSKNYDHNIPCHRVICSNGTLGGYNNGGLKTKRRILQAEMKLK